MFTGEKTAQIREVLIIESAWEEITRLFAPSLAHEQKGVRAVYNKAEYREQRTAMLQDWADMIDEWTA